MNNLRTTHSIFKYLCREVGPFVIKKTTQMREPISVERRVVVTIWRLATNVEYRALADIDGFVALARTLKQETYGCLHQ